MNKKIWGDTITGLCFIIFGLAFLAGSIALGIGPHKQVPGPGPGFFPALCAGFTIFFGIWVVYEAIKKGSADFFGNDPEQLSNIKLIAFTVLVFVIFMGIWYFVTFYLGIVALCLICNRAFSRSWKFNVIFSIVVTGLLYLVFERLLSVQFEI